MSSSFYTTEQEKALEQIANLLREADDKLREAAELANKHNVSFDWSGPTYGMGGWYDPVPNRDFEQSDDQNWSYSDDYGWTASSQSC